MAENGAAKTTEYMVLEWDSAGNGWKQRGTHPGSTANAAIRNYLNGTAPPDAREYVAVPVRSWNPVTVAVETKTVLKLT